MAIPFLCMAQVADPEPTDTALPQTGFTATVDVFQTASNDATKAVDGSNATFWQSTFSSAVVNLAHWVRIDVVTLRNIDSIYIVDRANLGNSIKTCTVSTSTDGITFAQQGGTYTLPYDSTQGKFCLSFLQR